MKRPKCLGNTLIHLLIPAGLTLCGAQAQVTWEPVAGDSDPVIEMLGFQSGSAPQATAAIPGSPPLSFPTLGTGVPFSSATASASDGGWDLTASGATAVYAAGINVASVQCSTDITSSGLEFNALSTGELGPLASVGLPSVWSASGSVSGSPDWFSAGDEFRYQFDLTIHSSVLSLSPGAMPDIGLLIEDGLGTELYKASNLGQLLGITDLTNQFYDNVQIPFTYDPANGSLKITWTGSSLVSANLLSGGANNVLRVDDSTLLRQSTVPEVSTAGLMGLAGMLFFSRRWRAAGGNFERGT